MVKKFLFKAAKSPWMGKLVGAAFQYGSWAIPVRKVYSSRDVVAFEHPQPSYDNHLILSPRKAVQNLQRMASDGLGWYVEKIWEAANRICEEKPAYHGSFVLVANGGKRQEVQQVHFHMFSNHAMVNDCAQGQADRVFFSNEAICVFAHPKPDWEIHFVIKPIDGLVMPENEKYRHAYFESVLRSIDLLNDAFHIVPKGYSLVYQCDQQPSDKEYPVFHVVSGKRLV